MQVLVLTVFQLKCDLKARYPSPCSRCSSNRLDCRTDVNFKRIPARRWVRPQFSLQSTYLTRVQSNQGSGEPGGSVKEGEEL